MGLVMSVALGGIVLALAGLVILIRGYRGKRINDLPMCRRCGFDLVGLPLVARESSEGGSVEEARCPECGLAVSTARNVRRGARRRSWRGVVLGTILLLAGILPIASVLVSSARRMSPYTQMPNWLLAEFIAGRLGGKTKGVDVDAMTEAVRRLPGRMGMPLMGFGIPVGGFRAPTTPVAAGDGWSDEQLAELASRAEAGINAATSPREVTSWLRIASAAMLSPKGLAPETVQAIAKASVVPSLVVRPLVRSGQMPYVEWKFAFREGPQLRGMVVGGREEVTLQVKMGDGSWSEPQLVYTSHRTLSSFDELIRPGTELLGLLRPKWHVNLEPGEHEVRVIGRYYVTLDPNGGMVRGGQSFPSEVPLSTIKVTTKLKVTPVDQPAVTLKDDPLLATAILKDVRVAAFRWRAEPGDGDAVGSLALAIVIDAPRQLLVNRCLIFARFMDADGSNPGEPVYLWLNSTSIDGQRVNVRAGLGLLATRGVWPTAEIVARYALDKPRVDLSIVPDHERLEWSMDVDAAGLEVEVKHVRVVEEKVYDVRPGNLLEKEFANKSFSPSRLLPMTGLDLLQASKDRADFEKALSEEMQRRRGGRSE